MGRNCAVCGCFCSRCEFSSNQWSKGEGYSRCRECVDGKIVYECDQCQRNFNSSNELNMHLQVHRPKNISCPLCGETRFRSGANAVQHVESGYCTGCVGRDNARQRIYEFASSRPEMRHLLSNVPMIEDGYSGRGTVPTLPYQCNLCGKLCNSLSQLMQHQDQKHQVYNNLRIVF